MTPDKFLVKASWNEAFASLTDIQLGQLMRAVFSYAKTGSLMPTTADQAVRVAFDFIRLDIDEDRAKYKARCERNRANAQKRWSKNTEKKKKSASTKPKKPSSKNTDPDAAIQDGNVNYSSLLNYWNSRVRASHSSMPEISSITPARQKLISDRLSEYNGDKRVIRNAFETALHTPFLNGKGPKKWVADFDWILHPDHFPRILEGSYGAPVYPKAEQPLPERKQMSPEETQMARRQQAQRRQQEAQEQLRKNILAAINAANANPKSLHARLAFTTYNNGTMQRLGIVWTPPTATADTTKSASL